MLRYNPMATVSMYVYINNPELSGDMVKYDPEDNNGLFFMGKRLEGVQGLHFLPKIDDRPLVAKFTVECSLGDTIEKPININA